MKITNVKTFLVGADRQNWLFVKVETDEGVYGWNPLGQDMPHQSGCLILYELLDLALATPPMLVKQSTPRHKGIELSA